MVSIRYPSSPQYSEQLIHTFLNTSRDQNNREVNPKYFEQLNYHIFFICDIYYAGAIEIGGLFPRKECLLHPFDILS